MKGELYAWAVSYRQSACRFRTKEQLEPMLSVKHTVQLHACAADAMGIITMMQCPDL